ncbi:alpha/beta hydrolase family protein [Tissierella creatinophila]|uniref:Prolyl tripeptidyl peptidase n=1 Tax=Tissierella creatinophila DSM 6911 TaxID=1123403 RepID=A0A1U7M3E8_TISCR|nr:S9 family peptidase [Tissierella creatinophila]OLS01844.1 prolyl tripeptidyl peptidase precursor [Tissierella creatinophila DSM 6911]
MEKLFLEDFTKYKYLSSLKFSPTASHTAFICNEVDLEDNSYKSQINLLDNNDNTIKKLKNSKHQSNLVWKDYETFIFCEDFQEDKKRREKGEPFTRICEMKIEDENPKELFEIPLNISSIKIIDDENFIFLASFDPAFSEFPNLDAEGKDELLDSLKEEKDYEILDEIPFWSNGEGFTNKKRTKLYLYNIAEEIYLPITDDFTDVYSFELDKDKENILMITNSFIDKKYTFTDLQIYNIEKDFLLKISPFEGFDYSYANFLEDKIIFIGSDMKDFGLNQNPHFYSCDLDGFRVKKISSDRFDFSTTNSIGSDSRYGSDSTTLVDESFLYFVTTEGDSSFINRIDINGKMEKLTNKKGSIDGFDVKNRNIEFIGLRSLRLQEIYLLKDKREIQLTNFNQWVMIDKTLSIPEKLTFRTEDATLIEGWVLKPTNFKLGKDYPAILNIHGGPKTAFGEVFFHEMQYLANEGFVVFFCNPRGSDGRGNKFADIRGKYGTIDYEDIMEFTDLVLEKYHFIDKDRLGVMGGSYGGFMTNWIIGHTGRFKAAISERSISNWISKFGTTDIGYYFVDDQIAATPWNDFNQLWNSSPMKYADKVTTPTLFIHSEEDYRCWLPEGIQMFTSLKYHGVESRLCMFRGENHELSRSGKPKHRIRRLVEIKNWFEKYLK